MALSCICPGSYTLLANLLRSETSSPYNKREAAYLSNWEKEYIFGAAHEIYANAELTLGGSLIGLPFTTAVELVYQVYW